MKSRGIIFVIQVRVVTKTSKRRVILATKSPAITRSRVQAVSKLAIAATFPCFPAFRVRKSVDRVDVRMLYANGTTLPRKLSTLSSYERELARIPRSVCTLGT